VTDASCGPGSWGWRRCVEGSMSVDLGDVCVSTYMCGCFFVPLRCGLRVFTLAAQVHELRQFFHAYYEAQIPHSQQERPHASLPALPKALRPRGKIGDRPHGDAHSTQFRNLRFCSPSTSRTQALAPSGPNPQPVTIMSHPAGSCSRALPIIHSAWAPSLPFLSSPAPGPIPAHPSFLAYDSNTSRAPSQRG